MPSLPCACCGRFITVKPQRVNKNRPNMCIYCYRSELERGYFRCHAETNLGARCKQPVIKGKKTCSVHSEVSA